LNFYKHHLGDYDGHTAHLSWDEDMAYTRLMRAYYRREQPIPQAEAYRLCRAQTRIQKQAVDVVLAEFFTLEYDGWHNKRCDEEITAYQAQASTNRRIAQQRTVRRSNNESLHEPLNESLTNHIPNHKPDTRTTNQEPLTTNQNQELQTPKPKVKNIGAVAPIIRPESVSEKVWNDFQQVRRAKKAPLTATALDGIESEAVKAGLSLEDALKIACARGWQGFEAKWLTRDKSDNAAAIAEAKRKLFGEKDITNEASRV
jgi:uncharacterized protein YdaU (DUF1376 family)